MTTKQGNGDSLINNDASEKHAKRLANLKPFKKGQSGNVRGRPKKEYSLTSLMKEMIEEVDPNDKCKRTWKEQLVIATFKNAIKGNAAALREVYERTDGKVPTPTVDASEGPVEIIVTYDR